MIRKITYTSLLGELVLNGGGSGKWRILQADGFAIPTRTAVTVNFAWEDGQSLVYSSLNARTITLGGDICSDSDTSGELSEAMKILNGDGTLKVEYGTKVRCIKCRTDSFTLGEKNGRYQRFALQLTADNPYFHDAENTEAIAFGYIPNIKNPFTLPCTFSYKTTSTTIENLGDAPAEPIIFIKHRGTWNYTGSFTNKIVIMNLSNDAEITLDHELTEGETVEINIPKRTVTSSVCGDILGKISLNTFLGDFVLEKDTNIICANANNPNLKLEIDIRYNNNYVEAVG